MKRVLTVALVVVFMFAQGCAGFSDYMEEQKNRPITFDKGDGWGSTD